MSPPALSPNSFPPLPANENSRLQMDSIKKLDSLKKNLVDIVKGISESGQVRKDEIAQLQKGQKESKNEIMYVKKFAEKLKHNTDNELLGVKQFAVNLNKNIISLALKADSANVEMASLYQQVRVLTEKLDAEKQEKEEIKTELVSMKNKMQQLEKVLTRMTTEHAATSQSSGNQNAGQVRVPQQQFDLRQIEEIESNSSISNRSFDPSIVMSGRVAAGHLSRIQAGSGQTFGFNNLPYQVKSESDYYQRIPDLKTSVPGLCVNPPQGRNVTNQNFQAHEDIDALREAEKAWGHTRHLIL